MTLDHTQVICQTLEDQADKAEETAARLEAVAAAHQGARDLTNSLESGMKGITPKTQEEINEEPELSDEAKVLALKYAARSMMRVANTLKSARDNQSNLHMLKTGEAKAYRDLAKDLRRQSQLRRDIEKGRAESIALGEASKAAKAKPKAKTKRRRKPRTKPSGAVDAN